MEDNKRQKLWNSFLNQNFCKANSITGNRPCDNGTICEKCSGDWIKIEFDKFCENWNDKYISRIWDKLQNMTICTSVYSIRLNSSCVLLVRKYQSSFDLSIMQGKKLIDYQDGLELKYNIVSECVTDVIDRNLDLFL